MWEEIIPPLVLHQQPSHDIIQTVNRLFKKCYNRPFKEIDSSIYMVEIQYWPLSYFNNIIVRKPHSRATPRYEEHPIVLVLYESDFYLIDGGNKINKWFLEQKDGPHKVAIIKRRDK